MTMIEAIVTKLQNPQLLHRLGGQALSIVQHRLTNHSWAPNAPLTVAIKGGSKPLRDSGQLLASLSYRIEGCTIIVSTVHPAAKLLHQGGTITPKNTRFLAIPAGAKTRSYMRTYGFTPRACIDGMKAAGYKVWPQFGKGAVLMAQNGNRGKPFVLFILKRSVKIPARPFMELEEEGRKQLAAALRREILS